MRCDCCDHILTPAEATRKFKLSGAYTDTCNACLSTIQDDSPYTETVDGEVSDDQLFDDDGEPIEEN